MNRDFGVWLIKAIDERNLSQNELGRRSGISAQQINNYINGKSHPRRDQIKKIAKVLGVSATIVGEKAGYLTPQSDPTKEEAVFLDYYRSLPPPIQKVFFVSVEAVAAQVNTGKEIIDFRKKGQNAGLSESELRDYFTKEDGIEATETNNSAFEESLSGNDKNKPTNRKGRKG